MGVIESFRESAVVVVWWKSEIPKRVQSGRLDETFGDAYEIAMAALEAQAQGRWGVSINTARDYARIVYLATEALKSLRFDPWLEKAREDQRWVALERRLGLRNSA